MDGPPDVDALDEIDQSVLAGLLARLGARVADGLRRQFAADLREVQHRLCATGGPVPDLVTMARQAHVLVGLAGTAGAGVLASRARGLLRAATQGDAAASARALSEILPRIDALAAFVATCPLPSDQTPP